MSKELKQVMVVQNIVGASGVAGISAVTGAKPDGYTLGVTPSAPLAMHPHMRKVPYTLDSFDFVGRILKAPYIVMVAKTAPWNTLDDMLRDIEGQPQHVLLRVIRRGQRTLLRHDGPLQEGRGAGPPRPLLRRRRRLPGHRGEPRAGLHLHRRIAGSSMTSRGWPYLDATRDPLLPNLPTVKESGVEAYYSQWMPLLAPKGLPADIKATLSDAMRKAMQSPEFVERLHKLNLVPGYLDSKDCRAFVEEESVRNAEVIKGLMAK